MIALCDVLCLVRLLACSCLFCLLICLVVCRYSLFNSVAFNLLYICVVFAGVAYFP